MSDTDGTNLPADVIETAETLTRRARGAVDPQEADAYRDRRDDLLADYGFRARVRAEDSRAVLVLHPADWLEDGTVDVDAVDTDRAIERPLSGAGDPDDWADVEADNRRLARRVADAHGDPHGRTAHALADFAGNHYAKPIGDLTPAELAEFRREYLPRNGWPTEEQLASLVESLRIVSEECDGTLEIPD